MDEHYKATTINGKKYSFLLQPVDIRGISINMIKENLLSLLQKDGMRFRLGEFEDIERIAAFQQALFDTSQVSVETKYELFRIIKYGYVLLLETDEGNIAAFYSTLQYNTPLKDAYGVRVGVLPQAGGHNYAALLAKLATVLAFEKESKYFHALMNPLNLKSASNVLNHVGYYCREFHTDLPGFGVRFEITIPLTLDILANSEIDITKVLEFTRQYEVKKDYHLVRFDDFEYMEWLYAKTDFKIIAFVKNGLIGPNDYYFAIRPLIQ